MIKTTEILSDEVNSISDRDVKMQEFLLMTTRLLMQISQIHAVENMTKQ
jgi:hypothetical protein